MSSKAAWNGFRAAALGLLALAFAGCPSLSVLHPATPVPEGRPAVTLAMTRAQVNSDTLENIELAVRYGFSDHLDAGVKLHGAGIAADVNVVLYRSRRVVIALDPMLAVSGGSTSNFKSEAGETTFGHATLNLLADVAVFDASAVTFGLRTGYALTNVQRTDPESGARLDPPYAIGSITSPLAGGLFGLRLGGDGGAFGIEVSAMRAFAESMWLWHGAVTLTGHFKEPQ